MSDFGATGVIFALALAHLLYYNLMDRWIWDRSEAIVTGVIRGRAISNGYRRLLLHVGWFINVGILVAVQCAATLGYVLLAGNVSGERVSMFAYVCALISAAGAVGWLMQAPFVYSLLRSELRQAEAD